MKKKIALEPGFKNSVLKILLVDARLKQLDLCVHKMLFPCGQHLKPFLVTHINELP